MAMPSVDEITSRIRSHELLTRPVSDNARMAVVIAHFNPCNYQTPVFNLLQTLDNLGKFDVPVFCGEVLCGTRSNADSMLPHGSATAFSWKSDSILFYKEIIWNLLESHIPKTIERLVFLDGDLLIDAEDDVFTKLDQALAASNFVQPFASAAFLDAVGSPIARRNSAGWAFVHDRAFAHDPRKYHCGFGMGVNRAFFRVCGGFFPKILGDGDVFLIGAVVGKTEYAMTRTLSESEAELYEQWAKKVHEWSSGKLGYCEAEVKHLHHGDFVKRDYDGRLNRVRGFDPKTDIEANISTGLAEWSRSAQSHKKQMITSVMDYFSARDEDAISH